MGATGPQTSRRSRVTPNGAAPSGAQRSEHQMGLFGGRTRLRRAPAPSLRRAPAPSQVGRRRRSLTIVRARDNKAGVYGTVTRRGRLTVGQPVFFEPAAVQREQL